MPSTPNAQLTKLAIGIAGVAAVAGISGRIAAGSPVAAQEPTASVAAVGTAATGRSQSSALTDDDTESGEHEGTRSFFSATPVQPQSSTLQQPQQQLQTRRTRSKHS